jgi:hypothetical protein
MTMTPSNSGDQTDPVPPSWEDQVEAELTWLRREVGRLNRELIKLGGRCNVLMKERDAALAKREHAHVQHVQRRRG